jgi:hypothetical protein
MTENDMLAPRRLVSKNSFSNMTRVASAQDAGVLQYDLLSADLEIRGLEWGDAGQDLADKEILTPPQAMHPRNTFESVRRPGIVIHDSGLEMEDKRYSFSASVSAMSLVIWPWEKAVGSSVPGCP